MAIDKEKLAEKTGRLAGQAKELLSNVDAVKAMRATDRFMSGVFKFGKLVAALFMFLALVVMVGSLVYCIFAGPQTIKIPAFAEVETTIKSIGQDDVGKGGVTNAEFRDLRKRYGAKVDALIEIGGMDARDDYNRIINSLADVDADLRSAYVNGALAFLKDYKTYAKKDLQIDFNGEKGLELYTTMFRRAQQKALRDKARADKRRTDALLICGGSFVSLILFLFIPLLLQIEENTRA